MNKHYIKPQEAIVIQMPALGYDDPDDIRFTNNDPRRLFRWLPEHCDYAETDLSALDGLETQVIAPEWLTDDTIDQIGNAVIKAGATVCRISLVDYYDDMSVYGQWQPAGWFKYEQVAA